VGINKTGADAITDKIGMRQHRLDKRNIGVDTRDAKFAQSAAGLLHHIGPTRGRRMNNDLGQ
jgi:hypothetical protein